MDRYTLIWIMLVTILLGSTAFVFTAFVEPGLNAQKDRNWQRERLEGQRHYVEGQYELAKTAYENALKNLTPGGKNPEKLASTLSELGRIESLLNHPDRSEKDFSEALSIYKQLLSGNPSPEENRALLQEGLIRSYSGLAQVHKDTGRSELAKQELERLFPIYVEWWHSQVVGQVEPDLYHAGNKKLKHPQVITKASPVLCAQMAADLTDLATICLNDGNFKAAQKIAYYLADLCSKAPINIAQKAKADLVYHRAFNLSESEPGIADQP